jgi:hypothetical protein
LTLLNRHQRGRRITASRRPEKLIKGLLVLADVPFTKTHDLGRLGTLAAPAYPQQAELFAATYLFNSLGI